MTNHAVPAQLRSNGREHVRVLVEENLYVQGPYGKEGPLTPEEIQRRWPEVVTEALPPEELPDAPTCPSLAVDERARLRARLSRALKMDEQDMREAVAKILGALAAGGRP